MMDNETRKSILCGSAVLGSLIMIMSACFALATGMASVYVLGAIALLWAMMTGTAAYLVCHDGAEREQYYQVVTE